MIRYFCTVFISCRIDTIEAHTFETMQQHVYLSICIITNVYISNMHFICDMINAHSMGVKKSTFIVGDSTQSDPNQHEHTLHTLTYFRAHAHKFLSITVCT